MLNIFFQLLCDSKQYEYKYVFKFIDIYYNMISNTLEHVSRWKFYPYYNKYTFKSNTHYYLYLKLYTSISNKCFI